MRTQPVKGTQDLLPEQLELRTWVERTLLSTYLDYGFRRVETPILESLDNLNHSEGGDNLNLIFQILKRGGKLLRAQPEALCDLGLRYDLTLPLARYCAAHREQLPLPFKAIQIGPAFRAERPQRGRLRQFTQCDIDILGEGSICAEIELIAVTAQALGALGFDDFAVLVNDRQVLRGLLAGLGFDGEALDGVCVSLDKLDKLGADGVAAELRARGCSTRAVNGLLELVAREEDAQLPELAGHLPNPEVARPLAELLASARRLAAGRYPVRFRPSLVRGQGYYTGAVFEVVSPAFPGALAGGGRYDGLTGKFTGHPLPAVGFSIGFERVCALLAERGWTLEEARPALALLYAPEAGPVEALARIPELKARYRVSALPLAPNRSKQLRKLAREGYRAAMDAATGELRPLRPSAG